MTKDTALKLALEALEKARRQIQHASPVAPHSCIGEAIRAIREALAAPQGEPVAWKLLNRVYTSKGEAEYDWRNDPVFDNTGYCPEPLYTHPAPSPLSDTDITSLAYDCNALPEVITDATLRVFARAIESHITGSKV